MAAILNIAQLKKLLNMPKVASSWFFISRVYSTKICKKTSVMSQNEVMCHIHCTTSFGKKYAGTEDWDVEEMWESFKQAVLQAMDSYIPTKTLSSKK